MVSRSSCRYQWDTDPPRRHNTRVNRTHCASPGTHSPWVAAISSNCVCVCVCLESSYSSSGYALTRHWSQQAPLAHCASDFSLQVMPSQHGSSAHSSNVPQSHSSSSSMTLLPQLRRSSICVCVCKERNFRLTTGYTQVMHMHEVSPCCLAKPNKNLCFWGHRHRPSIDFW